MARSVNEDDHRAKRTAILDAAQALIETQGYEQTSIQDILDRVAISKGAFYHYFDSKQSLLLALVERRGDALEQVILPVVHDRKLSGSDKLLRFFAVQDQFKKQGKNFVLELARTWQSDENAVFRLKLSAEGKRRMSPWLVSIIEQGVAEGDFTTAHPDQAAHIVLAIVDSLAETAAASLSAGDPLAQAPAAQTPPATTAALRSAVEATGDAIERVLGATTGTVTGALLEALAGW
jgi:AcrR family transcriptional regulator